MIEEQQKSELKLRIILNIGCFLLIIVILSGVDEVVSLGLKKSKKKVSRLSKVMSLFTLKMKSEEQLSEEIHLLRQAREWIRVIRQKVVTTPHKKRFKYSCFSFFAPSCYRRHPCLSAAVA